jgi:hypothetical protein
MLEERLRNKNFKKKDFIKGIFLALGILFSSSCLFTKQMIEAPGYVRTAAYNMAEEYIGMPYEWGGQDFINGKGIDCSGMVVNIYKIAIENTEYKLLFDDTTVKNLYNKYTSPITNPQAGDLIFMGPEDSSKITHVAIFHKNEKEFVYFIDSTILEDINGVTHRFYQRDNPKIKEFGRMLLLKESY